MLHISNERSPSGVGPRGGAGHHRAHGQRAEEEEVVAELRAERPALLRLLLRGLLQRQHLQGSQQWSDTILHGIGVQIFTGAL